MDCKKELVTLIGEEKYNELDKKIPEKFKQSVHIYYSSYLLQKSEQEILDFYSNMMQDNSQGSIPKLTGNIMIVTNHLHDLLIKLVQVNETNKSILKKIIKFDLHYLIIFCTARYNIPDDYFIPMMRLKHFRNMVSHNFNEVMETSFYQAINPISEGHLLIIFLTQLIRKKHEIHDMRQL